MGMVLSPDSLCQLQRGWVNLPPLKVPQFGFGILNIPINTSPAQ